MLFVVATPIGNLDDLSKRALAVLQDVAVIAAEDTRHTARLLQAAGVKTQVVACHAHNEGRASASLLARLRQGEDIALVSDAGTPLLSDPGYELVDACHAAGIPVAPVPGPSAISAALSVAGLPVSRFAFEGFLPAKAGERRRLLADLAEEPRTLVVFEAPHRLGAALADISAVLGPERRLTLARELTKRFEQVVRGTAVSIGKMAEAGEIPARGECVLVIAGHAASAPAITPARLLAELAKALPPAKAAAIAAKLAGGSRADYYKAATQLNILGK